MAINTDLLIAAPMLQNYFVDKVTGAPLVNGIVTLWVDDSRYVDYKNWYYQTGSPGAYSWITLPNPLHLSSVGTIQDPNGNDVIPFYYPYEENNQNVRQAYFITVYSADENGDPATLQFTRENFPYAPSNVSPTAENPTWRNYLINNVYWQNIGTLDCTGVTNQQIAPSQHDVFSFPDIRFIKDMTGATDTLSFLPMTTTLDNDITPENYLNVQCSNVQDGETVKCIQYPISLHVKTLQNVQSSIVFHGQNAAGSENNYVDLYVYQFLGTGALSQPDPILIQRVTLGTEFQKYIIPFIFPDAASAVLSAVSDDALYLRVQYPLSALFNINHTKPQIYLSTDVPDNDFDTYDQIDAVVNSPRTGDTRTSYNTYSGFGWVAANDGTIGSAGSGATVANVKTWPLYSLLWTNVINTYAPVSGGRGSSAYADFVANKTLTLTKILGRAIASVGQPSSGGTGTTWALGQTTGEELHSLTVPELAAHAHTFPGSLQNSSVGGSTVYATVPDSTTTTTSSTGSGTGHNTIQPTTFMNVFFKL